MLNCPRIKRIYLLLSLVTLCFTACGNNSNQSAHKQLQLTLKADSISRQRFKTLEFIANDKVAFATIDTRYVNFTGKNEFPLSLFITINTDEKDGNGHPTKKETDIYNRLELEIIEALNEHLISAFIGNTTMDGFRDLIFYIKSSDQKKASQILTELKQKHSRIREYVFEEDSGWEAVADFYKALKQN